MIKRIIFVAIFALSITACSDKKKEEKALKDEVLSFHEQVMGDDEKALINKMKLDTLKQQAVLTHADTLEMSKLSTDIVKADNAMGDWMSKLQVDYENANHEEVMKYWRNQQTQVKRIDSALNSAASNAAAYIGKAKKQ
jgi:hypothetical protein